MENKHILKEFIDVLRDVTVKCDSVGDENILIESLTCDNREVSGASVFVCKGAHFKEEYLADAVKKGAVLYVSEKEYGVNCPSLIVSDIRAAMNSLALLFFNNAPCRIKSVGITGTKGKSTTAYYVKNILDGYSARECAILSSIDNYDGVIREESHLTTPEPIDLHRHFDNAVKSGLEYLVMEVSSQALKYGRVAAVSYDVAVFNNIGSDHISPIEHPDFEDYLASKLRIFEHCAVACVNKSAEFSDRVLEAAAKTDATVVTYGYTPDCDIYCSEVKKADDGIYFTVKYKGGEDKLSITMPGLFNVDNALAAYAVSVSLGVPVSFIRDGLREARAAGRMEVFSSDDGEVTVIVDYAHNKMSFDALFKSTALEYPGKKMISVFGCPGMKAHLRRRDLALSAGENADLVIITEEDSGEEPFESISRDIEKNLVSVGCSYEIIEDRGEAIRRAVNADIGPRVILLTGKGRETRQKRGILYIDVPSDVEYTEEFLKDYNKAKALI